MATPVSDDNPNEKKIFIEKIKDNYARYLEKKRQLIHEYCDFLKTGEDSISLKKDTSNLFRNGQSTRNKIDVRHFNQVIAVDPIHRVAEIEGMTPYETIVAETLKFGYLPAVVPELKSITIGGALAGVGIESSSFRYGLVHETILEFEALLGDGRIVTCTRDNEYKDLFYSFPNTYGTLGYALKIKVKLIPAKNYIKLTHIHFRSGIDYFAWIEKICTEQRKRPTIDYIDGVVFSPADMVVTIAEFVDNVPCTSNYRYLNIYYRSVQNKKNAKEAAKFNIQLNRAFDLPANTLFKHDYLTTLDYIWRWDSDWFWCSKHFFMQTFLMRLLFGKWALKSTVYWKIRHFINQKMFIKKALEKIQGKVETVIQDIEVTIDKALNFLTFFQKEIGITPIWICPTQAYQPDRQFSFYKMDPRALYINFGFWDVVPEKAGKSNGYYNRKIEDKVSALNGNKSLYSNIFYTPEEFWKIYDSEFYGKLKKQYDPLNRLGNLYQKCISKKS